MTTVEVQLKVHAILQPMLKNPLQMKWTLPAGSTVHQLLDLVGFGSRASRVLVSVNDRLVDKEQTLTAGDRVTILPVLGGG